MCLCGCVCVVVCVSAVCVCCVCWSKICVLLRTPRPSAGPPSPPDRPKFRFFFSFSHPHFHSFFLSGDLLVEFFLSPGLFSCLFSSLWGLLVEFWWCFGRSGPQMCLFSPSGCPPHPAGPPPFLGLAPLPPSTPHFGTHVFLVPFVIFHLSQMFFFVPFPFFCLECVFFVPGPAACPFACVPTSRLVRIDPQPFRVMLLRRLRSPSPFCSGGFAVVSVSQTFLATIGLALCRGFSEAGAPLWSLPPQGYVARLARGSQPTSL